MTVSTGQLPAVNVCICVCVSRALPKKGNLVETDQIKV